MPENPNRKITFPMGGGMLKDLALRVKLVLRLLMDGRVNPLVKLLPIGSAVYLLMPDLAPGPIDDAAIIWLATYLFVELCPPNVVEEHMHALNAVGEVLKGETAQEEEAEFKAEDIIEAEVIEQDRPPDPK